MRVENVEVYDQNTLLAALSALVPGVDFSALSVPPSFRRRLLLVTMDVFVSAQLPESLARVVQKAVEDSVTQNQLLAKVRATDYENYKVGNIILLSSVLRTASNDQVKAGAPSSSNSGSGVSSSSATIIIAIATLCGVMLMVLAVVVYRRSKRSLTSSVHEWDTLSKDVAYTNPMFNLSGNNSSSAASRSSSIKSRSSVLDMDGLTNPTYAVPSSSSTSSSSSSPSGVSNPTYESFAAAATSGKSLDTVSLSSEGADMENAYESIGAARGARVCVADYLDVHPDSEA